MRTRSWRLWAGSVLISGCLSAGAADDNGAAVATNAVIRKWTSTGGQTVEARFVRLRSGVVTLRTKDGKDVQIPFGRLASDDQTLAKQSASPRKPKPAAPSYAGNYTGTYRSEGWKGPLTCVVADGDEGQVEAAFEAVHSDGKTYKYKGVLKPTDDGKYDGLCDVRRPKEFRVTGSFKGPKFTAAIALVPDKGDQKPTGEFSMTRNKRK